MNKQLESHILVALFKATIEQQTALKGKFKHKSNQSFNQWQRLGNKLLDELEEQNQVNEDYLNSITDLYHSVGNLIREEQAKKEK